MKTTALHLVRGSWAITYRALGRACAWCMAGEGSNKVWRALGLVVGIGTAYRLTGSSPAVAGGVFLAGLGVAWMHSPPPGEDPEGVVEEGAGLAAEAGKAAQRTAKKVNAQVTGSTGGADLHQPTPSDPLEPAAFLDRLRTLIGDRNGVLLRDVVADLHAAGVPAEWGVPDARALCTTLGVPVKGSIKVAGETSVGVHRTALPPAAAPSPPASSIEAPEAGSSEGSSPMTCGDYPPTTSDPAGTTGLATGIATPVRRFFRR